MLSRQGSSARGSRRRSAVPPSAPGQRAQSDPAARDRGVALQLAPGTVRRRLLQVPGGDGGVLAAVAA